MASGRIFLLLGSLSGFLAVAAGAFGAHALKLRVEPELLEAFETGARYQAYHALALLACAWAVSAHPSLPARAAGWLFAAGSAVFSGSLYALALTGIRAWGAVTPLGGTLLLLGWLSLALSALR